jgi:hypothetical protein
VRIIEGPTQEVLKLEVELRKQKKDRVAAEAKRLALEKRVRPESRVRYLNRLETDAGGFF